MWQYMGYPDMKMTMKKLILLIPSLVFVVYVTPVVAVICPSIADVYIDQREPDTNFNFRTRIIISYHPTYGIARGLIKYDIPDEIDASEITAATLYLSGSYHTGGGDAIQVACYALNAPFGEGSATWNSLDGGDYDSGIAASGNLPAGNDWETSFDVTALVAGNLQKLRDNGMLMRLQTEGPLSEYQNIASREFEDLQDFAPYLDIEYSESSSSSTTTEPLKTSTTSMPVSTTTSSIITTSTTTTTIFIDTTTIVSSSTTTSRIPPCLVESIYGEYSEEVVILRYFRDQVLRNTPEGREVIQLYYMWSPFIVRLVEEDNEFRDEIKMTIDEFMDVINDTRN
jgi:hypothetical protein